MLGQHLITIAVMNLLICEHYVGLMLIHLKLPFHWRGWVRDALRCDGRAAELKINLIQSQCDLSMDANWPRGQQSHM